MSGKFSRSCVHAPEYTALADCLFNIAAPISGKTADSLTHAIGGQAGVGGGYRAVGRRTSTVRTS